MKALLNVLDVPCLKKSFAWSKDNDKNVICQFCQSLSVKK